ncbi:MAG: DUF4115 domain-containing protein [Acidimicrobiales bacterium]
MWMGAAGLVAVLVGAGLFAHSQSDQRIARRVPAPISANHASVGLSASPPKATTTPPVPTGLVPSATTAQQATYDFPASSFSTTITTSGPCWVQVKTAPGGSILFEATLNTGQSKDFPSQHQLWLRAGDPSHLSVGVNGMTLVLPPLGSSPYNFSIQGSSMAPTAS